jgi:hypothetical protein
MRLYNSALTNAEVLASYNDVLNQAAAAPEPDSLLLLSAGIAGVGFSRMRDRSSSKKK